MKRGPDEELENESRVTKSPKSSTATHSLPTPVSAKKQPLSDSNVFNSGRLTKPFKVSLSLKTSAKLSP
jgi:hypothetical protein